MDPLPLTRIIEATGGRWLGGDLPEEPVLDVATDSREVAPGALFVPLRGKNFDGRDFIRAALEAGARASLLAGSPPEGLRPGAPLIAVDDSLAALERLAAFWRDEVGAERIAVTGTVGKTTTKEFLAVLLATRFPTTRAPKSFNNRLGVSLTLLTAVRGTRRIVCEAGTSAPGELEALSRLIRPSSVIVTEIGRAHLSGLGSLAGVIRAKAEVFQGLESGGTAFIHEAAPGREELEAAARAAGAAVLLFGWERGDYVIRSCRRLEAGDIDLPAGEVPVGFRFRIQDPGGHEEEVILSAPGRHNVLNALAAIACAREAGLDWAAIRSGVRELQLPAQRFAVERVGGVVLVDDSYNASPRSVTAALEEAGEAPLIAPGGKRYLVLGDLLELGQASEEIHQEIGRWIRDSGRFAGLIAVGPESRHAARAALSAPGGDKPAPGLWVHEVDGAAGVADVLLGVLEHGDLALFKASRGVGLERAVEEVRTRLLSRSRGGSAEGPAADGRVRAGGLAPCSTISIA